MIIAFEDVVHEAILRKIIPTLEDDSWIITGGKVKLDMRVTEWTKAAPYQKIIVLRDLDNDEYCAPEFLRTRRLVGVHENFVFRLSVREAEAWILADKQSFCNHFRCSYQRLDRLNVDQIDDPKKLLLKTIHNGRLTGNRKRLIVDKKDGEFIQLHGYNTEIINYIETSWNLNAAIRNSESLKRSTTAIRELLSR